MLIVCVCVWCRIVLICAQVGRFICHKCGTCISMRNDLLSTCIIKAFLICCSFAIYELFSFGWKTSSFYVWAYETRLLHGTRLQTLHWNWLENCRISLWSKVIEGSMCIESSAEIFFVVWTCVHWFNCLCLLSCVLSNPRAVGLMLWKTYGQGFQLLYDAYLFCWVSENSDLPLPSVLLHFMYPLSNCQLSLAKPFRLPAHKTWNGLSDIVVSFIDLLRHSGASKMRKSSGGTEIRKLGGTTFSLCLCLKCSEFHLQTPLIPKFSRGWSLYPR